MIRKELYEFCCCKIFFFFFLYEAAIFNKKFVYKVSAIGDCVVEILKSISLMLGHDRNAKLTYHTSRRLAPKALQKPNSRQKPEVDVPIVLIAPTLVQILARRACRPKIRHCILKGGIFRGPP